MPVTALEFKEESEVVRLKFITNYTKEKQEIEVWTCDNTFVPSFITGLSEDVKKRSEENYHRELRIASKDKFIKYESTNPEWNE